MNYLILVRHGESRWNLLNRFTGWVDVPLSLKGEREAELLSRHIEHLRLDMAFTSHLERAHQTLLAVLCRQECTGIFLHDHGYRGMTYPFIKADHEIPVTTTWLLNERNYGSLQGKEKSSVAKRYGAEKVFRWRRGFEDRPPGGESLSDVYDRVVPYFRKSILPKVKNGKNVLVAAHGNTLRAIVKYLDKIPDDQIVHLELSPAKPVMYGFQNGKLKKLQEHSFNRPMVW